MTNSAGAAEVMPVPGLIGAIVGVAGVLVTGVAAEVVAGGAVYEGLRGDKLPDTVEPATVPLGQVIG